MLNRWLSRTLSQAVTRLRWGFGLSILGALDVWPDLTGGERRALARGLSTVAASLFAAVAGALTIAPWWVSVPALVGVALKLDEVNDAILAARDRRTDARDRLLSD